MAERLPGITDPNAPARPQTKPADERAAGDATPGGSSRAAAPGASRPLYAGQPPAPAQATESGETAGQAAAQTKKPTAPKTQQSAPSRRERVRGRRSRLSPRRGRNRVRLALRFQAEPQGNANGGYDGGLPPGCGDSPLPRASLSICDCGGAGVKGMLPRVVGENHIWFDFPLVITIYFSVGPRSPIQGMLIGGFVVISKMC